MFRTKAVELMLANGHSRTWMIGNTIVTITTSGTYIGQDGNCDNCLALRQRTVNMSPKESAKTERNVKQKITAADVTTEDSHIQSPDEKGHGTFTCHGTGTQTPAGADESSKPEVKSEFHSGALSDRRLSGQFVAINPQNCRCVCQGWAEIFIRRPSGNISWIMRIQNRATSWLESDVSTALIDDPQIDECKFDTCRLELCFFYFMSSNQLCQRTFLALCMSWLIHFFFQILSEFLLNLSDINTSMLTTISFQLKMRKKNTSERR